jgi:hypothetical protein
MLQSIPTAYDTSEWTENQEQPGAVEGPVQLW